MTTINVAPDIAINCHLPESFSCSAVLGECRCDAGPYHEAHRAGRITLASPNGVTHADTCPARPVRVTCSVRGKTWEESEVTDVQRQGAINAYLFDAETPRLAALAACRERWSLVKALVTGEPAPVDPFGRPRPIPPLYVQRDAVFAALADMARLEDAHAMARQRAYDAMDPSGHTADSEHMRARQKARDSIAALAAYVGCLIEQVGALQ